MIVVIQQGIATGKSTTADLFRERGIVVFDADRSVHHHMGCGTGRPRFARFLAKRFCVKMDPSTVICQAYVQE